MVEPRHRHVPSCVESLGPEAVQWSRDHGLSLDLEQEHVLEHSLGLRDNGRWAPFEVGFDAPRQNGKGEVLMARELFGLFALEEAFLVHSAHEFKTSERHFQRVEAAIRRSPELFSQIKRSPRGRVIGFRYSHGDEAIELQDGRRIEFRTRTASGLRGFDDVALLVLDEAMILNEFAHGSMFPTVRASKAKRGPQIWYAGSAADQMTHAHAVVWARVRERGIKGDDPSLAYFEWSLDFADPDDVPEHIASDPAEWRKVNWAIERGRVLEEHMAYEFRSLGRRQFAVELLGVGDWPRTDGYPNAVIPIEVWNALEDAGSEPLQPFVLTFDVTPSRTRSSIAISGKREDGLTHCELADYGRGTGWVVPRLVELKGKYRPQAIVCDEASPAAALVPALEQAGITVETVNGPEHARSWGIFCDIVEQGTLRHRGGDELASAIRGAVTRPLGERSAWSRKNSNVDISPLVAVTLGVGYVLTHEPARPMVAFV